MHTVYTQRIESWRHTLTWPGPIKPRVARQAASETTVVKVC
jgi:hypothetical protein